MQYRWRSGWAAYERLPGMRLQGEAMAAGIMPMSQGRAVFSRKALSLNESLSDANCLCALREEPLLIVRFGKNRIKVCGEL